MDSGRCPPCIFCSPTQQHAPRRSPAAVQEILKAADPDLRIPRWLKERKQIIDTCLEMNSSGINQGTSGNVSVRVDGGFLITPSGIPYNTMTPDMIVFMDLEGGYYGDYLPSSEWRMHYDVYKAFPQAKAILHAHPTYSTALSVQRRNIPAFHYMIGCAGGKEIRCAEYGTFGSQELSDSVVSAMEGGIKACLMANHGMICYDKSLGGAMKLAIEVECLAQQYIEASTMGPPPVLSDGEMDIILAKFKTYGKQSAEIAGMNAFQREHAVIPPPRRDRPRAVTAAAAREDSLGSRDILEVARDASQPARERIKEASQSSGLGMIAYGCGAIVLAAGAIMAKRAGLLRLTQAKRGDRQKNALGYTYEGKGKWTKEADPKPAYEYDGNGQWRRVK